MSALAGAALVSVLVAGCGDSSEIVTFTDRHGRACTAAVTVGGGTDADRQVASLDCDYPPAGTTPGPEGYRKLPRR